MDKFIALTGAIAGILGLIVSIAAYWRTGTLKSMDLRIDLRSIVHDIDSRISSLPGLIDKADGSRKAILAAKELVQSGTRVAWEAQVREDREHLAGLVASTRLNYRKLRHNDLEDALISARCFNQGLIELGAKYEKTMADDDAYSKLLMQQAMQRVNRQSN